jgi:undecaprenyl-diphosphatase
MGFSFWESMDRSLFLFLNRELQNPFLDWFMPFVTDLKKFTYLLIALGAWILWKERRAGLVFLIFIGLTLLVTDQISSHVLKDWIGRIRPCHTLTNIHLLTDCNTSFSFPSSHAVNIFAAAYFLSQLFRRLKPLLYAIGAIVGFSRIYIGIHYPSDVFGGAMLGLIIAWPMRCLKDQALEVLVRSPKPEGRKDGTGHSEEKTMQDQKE